jgi:hypothetical protein
MFAAWSPKFRLHRHGLTASLAVLAACLNAILQPLLDFCFDPPNRPAAEGDGRRKAALRNAEINRTAGKSGACLDGG